MIYTYRYHICISYTYRERVGVWMRGVVGVGCGVGGGPWGGLGGRGAQPPDHDIQRARAMLPPRPRYTESESDVVRERPYTESESDFVRERGQTTIYRERERFCPRERGPYTHAHARTHGIVCHRPPSTTSQITRGGTSPRYEFRIRLFSCHPPSPAHMLGL